MHTNVTKGNSSLSIIWMKGLSASFVNLLMTPSCGGCVNLLEGQEALLRDLDRLD